MWLKDAHTIQPTLCKGKYLSVKNILVLGKGLFPGIQEIKNYEGVGYTLFDDKGYSALKETLKRLDLQLTYLYLRSSLENLIQNKEVTRV